MMEIVGAMIGQTLADSGFSVIPSEIAADSTGMHNGVAGVHYNIYARDTQAVQTQAVEDLGGVQGPRVHHPALEITTATPMLSTAHSESRAIAERATAEM